MEFRTTIGLEIHAELNTASKMFCGCRNDPEEADPNVNICPVCMAHPGSLPVINKEAVRKVLQVGAAVDGTLANKTVFDRKNYFYPDIPKGYQVSQYKDPLVLGGQLAGIEITRVHLEEDTARSTHESERSLLDFNRAGVPLMELVTEPVIHDAATAGIFARELQLLLRYLGTSEANMEKGEMRVEANISISTSDVLGTKVEIKNLNSFRSVESAIDYEIRRQRGLLEKGEKITQETRGWDENKQVTFSQRKKESSHDYRYFPEPDLPELVISEIPEFRTEQLRKELPELPSKKRERYLSEEVPREYVEMFVQNERLGHLYEETARLNPQAKKLIANYIGSDIAGLIAKFGEQELKYIVPQELALLMGRVMQGDLSSRGAKSSILGVFTGGKSITEISQQYLQQNDLQTLEKIVRGVIEANQSVAADYKAGKTSALQFLIGQGMKESKGSANPALLAKIFTQLLD